MEIQKDKTNSSFSRIDGLCSIKMCKLSVFTVILRVIEKERGYSRRSESFLVVYPALYSFQAQYPASMQNGEIIDETTVMPRLVKLTDMAPPRMPKNPKNPMTPQKRPATI